MSSIALMERYALVFFHLQGGGLYIYGTATLTNTNVYSNTEEYTLGNVSAPSAPCLHVSSIPLKC